MSVNVASASEIEMSESLVFTALRAEQNRNGLNDLNLNQPNRSSRP
jgi:hypothetical protein